MKTLKLLFLLLFVPLVFHAQKSLTGLWIGTLSNDSTTIRKDQSFEIALTQYKEKVYGYSRSTFIINDTLYHILKRVKGTIQNDVCEVMDDEIITHNFPTKPDKGVKLISTFRRNLQDSTWHLDGNWKTSKSKTRKYIYYSISGKISLKSEPNIAKSKIFPHLEELNMADDVAFYKESKKTNQQSVAANQNGSPADTKSINNPKKEEKKQSAESGLAKIENPKPSTPLPANTVVQQQKKDPNNKTSINELKTQEEVVKKNETIPTSEEAVAFTGIKKSGLPASNMPAEQKKNVTSDIAK